MSICLEYPTKGIGHGRHSYWSIMPGGKPHLENILLADKYMDGHLYLFWLQGHNNISSSYDLMCNEGI
jgi:hypothetical protein